MIQAGFFDLFSAYARLDKCTDPLVKLNDIIEWELFRAQLQSIRNNDLVGRKGFDVVMMFKVWWCFKKYDIDSTCMIMR